MKSIKFLDRNWILLIISIILGGLAAWAIGKYLQVKEGEIRAIYDNDKVQYSKVVVATRVLNKGELIQGGAVAVRDFPTEYLPVDAVHPKDFSRVADKLLLTSLAPGKPLLYSYIPKIDGEQFSDILREGRRSVTISISDKNSTANMLVAGDHVDLYLKRKSGDEGLYLLLKKVTVLATGRKSISERDQLKQSIYGDENEAYATITLDLSLRDAGRISLAQEYGDFVTLLRNRKDDLAVNELHLTESDVFLHQKKQHQVEYIIGGSGQKGIASGIIKKTEQDNKGSLLKRFVNLNNNNL